MFFFVMVDESGSAPFLDLVIDMGALITSKSACFQKEGKSKA